MEGLLVAKTGKTGPAGQPGPGGDTKQVKVSVAFHRRLKIIAAALGREMGQLVEEQMAKFIETEWKRLNRDDQGGPAGR